MPEPGNSINQPKKRVRSPSNLRKYISEDVNAAVKNHSERGFWKITWRPMQASAPSVDFDAFVENFSDNWSTSFNTETVYGRMDPIYTFQNTQRRMQLSFAVPSVSVEHGIENLEKFERLVSFLYPAYELQPNGQRVMSSPPILQLKFGNLIQNADSRSNLLGINADNDSDPTTGLLVAVNGFNMNPNLDLGFYHPYRGQFVPKSFVVDCDMGVIHKHALGWDGNNFMGGSYPYNVAGDPALEINTPPSPPVQNDYKQNKQTLDSRGNSSTGEVAANLGPEQRQSISAAEVEQMSKSARDYEIEQEQQEQIFSDPDDFSNYASFPEDGS